MGRSIYLHTMVFTMANIFQVCSNVKVEGLADLVGVHEEDRLPVELLHLVQCVCV